MAKIINIYLTKIGHKIALFQQMILLEATGL